MLRDITRKELIVLIFLLLAFFSCFHFIHHIDRRRNEESSLEDTKAWLVFKKTFNKSHLDPEEDMMRKRLFLARRERIKKLNFEQMKAGKSLRFGINQMSDWTSEERDALFSQMSMDKLGSDINLYRDQGFLDQVLKSQSSRKGQWHDWRNWVLSNSSINTVKDMGKCGAHWTYTTTGMLEWKQILSSYMHAGIPYVQFKEQLIVDHGRNGCQDGQVAEVLAYAAEYGLEPETTMCYNKSQYYTIGTLGFRLYGYEHCEGSLSRGLYTNDGFTQLPKGEESTLLEVLDRYGPIAVTLNLDRSTLLDYKSGLYDSDCGDGKHSFLLMGYNKTLILKSALTDQWGEEGYMRVRKGKNYCGLSDEAVIASFKSRPAQF